MCVTSRFGTVERARLWLRIVLVSLGIKLPVSIEHATRLEPNTAYQTGCADDKLIASFDLVSVGRVHASWKWRHRQIFPPARGQRILVWHSAWNRWAILVTRLANIQILLQSQVLGTWPPVRAPFCGAKKTLRKKTLRDHTPATQGTRKCWVSIRHV